MRNKTNLAILIIFVFCISGCQKALDIIDELKHHNTQPEIKDFATGLISPLGIEADAKGQLWVTEAGTGLTNDGQLSLITPQGRVYPVVKNFPASASEEGAIFGLNHLFLKDGTLYMLHGIEGKLYKFNISSFQPGDAPLQASQLQFEDIGTFVKAHDFEDDTNESDLFNLTAGPDGDLFIVDAGANAIIRRKSATGALSIFATIPHIDNPGGDPARIQPVPTGIVFDGYRFLVCCFTGFPFPAQKATIFQVDLQGNSSVYQTGLSSLTDIELGNDLKPVVIEFGIFNGQGFDENSGSMKRSAPWKNTTLVSGLNFPNSLKRVGAAYYIAQTYDGKILKVVL